MYKGEIYGISKSEFNGGRSIKIYAESLSANNFVSLNYYKTSKGDVLRPCEMTKEKVRNFLLDVSLL